LRNLQPLLSACGSYGKIVPGIPAVHANGTAVVQFLFNWPPKDKKTSKGNYIVAWVMIGPILLIVAIFITLYVASLLFMALAFLLVVPPGNFLITLGFGIGVLFCLARMQENRLLIRRLAGTGFQDDHWGFGQVISVFVWIPSSIKLLVWITLFILHAGM
jgi:hypothetical protein